MGFRLRTPLIVVPFVAAWVAIHLALRYAFFETSYWHVAALVAYLGMMASGLLLVRFTGGRIGNTIRVGPMLRYKLRTLLIVLAVAPALLAGAWGIWVTLGMVSAIGAAMSCVGFFAVIALLIRDRF